MLALELLEDESCEDRLTLFDFDAVHFLESEDDGLKPFPNGPRSGSSLVPESLELHKLPDQCPALTGYSFDPADTSEEDLHLDSPVRKPRKAFTLKWQSVWQVHSVELRSLRNVSTTPLRLLRHLRIQSLPRQRRHLRNQSLPRQRRHPKRLNVLCSKFCKFQYKKTYFHGLVS